MKKLILTPLFAAGFLLSVNAQEVAQEKAASRIKETNSLKDFDWTKVINSDMVANGSFDFNLNTIEKGSIVRVRFYDSGMKPLIPAELRKGALDFRTVKDNGIVDVRSLSDGGIGIVFITKDRIGAFIETVVVNTNYRPYTFIIKGIIQDPNEDEQKKEE
jgi:hypothetical protein